MNAERRKQLHKLSEILDAAKSDLESIRDDEQKTFDNMPESIQGGEKGDTVTAAIDALEEAVGDLDNALSNISTAAE